MIVILAAIPDTTAMVQRFLSRVNLLPTDDRATMITGRLGSLIVLRTTGERRQQWKLKET